MTWQLIWLTRIVCAFGVAGAEELLAHRLADAGRRRRRRALPIR